MVLGEGFWKRRFGSDPGVVGRSVTLDAEPHVIIGILAPFDTEAIRSPTGPPDVWLPFQIDPNTMMQGHFFQAAGRYRHGFTPAMANAQLQLAANEFRRRFPNVSGPQNGFGAQPLQDIIVRNVRSSLWVLVGADHECIGHE